MDYFTELTDHYTVLRRQGVFTQHKLFRRGRRIYAELSKDKFIGLRDHAATSVPSITWDQVSLMVFHFDELGWMVIN